MSPFVLEWMATKGYFYCGVYHKLMACENLLAKCKMVGLSSKVNGDWEVGGVGEHRYIFEGCFSPYVPTALCTFAGNFPWFTLTFIIVWDGSGRDGAACTMYIVEGFRVFALIRIQICPGNPVPKKSTCIYFVPTIFGFCFTIAATRCPSLWSVPTLSAPRPLQNQVVIPEQTQLIWLKCCGYTFIVFPLIVIEKIVEPVEQPVLQGIAGRPKGGLVPRILSFFLPCTQMAGHSTLGLLMPVGGWVEPKEKQGQQLVQDKAGGTWFAKRVRSFLLSSFASSSSLQAPVFSPLWSSTRP